MTDRGPTEDARQSLAPRVEFALDARDAVAHASSAALSGAYTCLQCRGGMTVVRAGSPPRFRHGSEAACDGSRVEREAGARLLADRLRRELSEEGAVTTWSPCRGPGQGEACPDGALMPARRFLALGGTVVCGPACPSPSDVAIVRQAQVVIGFELVALEAPDAGHAALPGAATPLMIRFALEDVLTFRALVPRNEDVPAAFCPACKARVSAALAEGVGATSEFLDEGFVREAARVHDVWNSVLAAAAAESSTSSGWARRGLSTTRRRRTGPW